MLVPLVAVTYLAESHQRGHAPGAIVVHKEHSTPKGIAACGYGSVKGWHQDRYRVDTQIPSTAVGEGRGPITTGASKALPGHKTAEIPIPRLGTPALPRWNQAREHDQKRNVSRTASNPALVKRKKSRCLHNNRTAHMEKSTKKPAHIRTATGGLRPKLKPKNSLVRPCGRTDIALTLQIARGVCGPSRTYSKTLTKRNR